MTSYHRTIQGTLIVQERSPSLGRAVPWPASTASSGRARMYSRSFNLGQGSAPVVSSTVLRAALGFVSVGFMLFSDLTHRKA